MSHCIIHPTNSPNSDSFRNKTPLLCVFIGSKEHILFGQFPLSILVSCAIVHNHPLQGSNVLPFSYQSSSSTTTSLHHPHFQRSRWFQRFQWQFISETNHVILYMGDPKYSVEDETYELYSRTLKEIQVNKCWKITHHFLCLAASFS